MAAPEPQPTNEDHQDDFYLGPRISTQPSPFPAKDFCSSGRHATIQGLSDPDIPNLWKNLRTPEGDDSVFNYLPQLRQDSPEAFARVLQSLRDEHGMVLYAIKADPNRLSPSPSSSPCSPTHHTSTLGLIAFLSITPQHRALEVGAVLYSLALQHTTAGTEAAYLLLSYAFGEEPKSPPSPTSSSSSLTTTPTLISTALSPRYRRVVWKCNSLNTSSRRAAERLGFVYEGTLRSHMVFCGRSRDSDFLSMLEGEWEGFVKAGFEAWLDLGNFGDGGGQVLGLGELRERGRVRVMGE